MCLQLRRYAQFIKRTEEYVSNYLPTSILRKHQTSLKKISFNAQIITSLIKFFESISKDLEQATALRHIQEPSTTFLIHLAKAFGCISHKMKV